MLLLLPSLGLILDNSIRFLDIRSLLSSPLLFAVVVAISHRFLCDFSLSLS